MKTKRRGFTLIELLVVIAIIGLLASVISASLNTARTKARDAKRVEELAQFRTALELYFDTYGVYPIGDNFIPGMGGCSGGTRDSSASDGFLNGGKEAECGFSPAGGLFWAGILPNDQPKDPINIYAPDRKYFYYYRVSADEQNYILAVYLEDDDEKMQNDGGLCDEAYEVGNGVGLLAPEWLTNCTP